MNSSTSPSAAARRLDVLRARISRVLQRRLSVVFPIALMTLLYWVSSVPGVIEPGAPAAHQVFVWVPPAVQNLMHIPVYAALAFLWLWYLRRWLGSRPAMFLAFALAAGYGLLDEWHQSFVPGRFASTTDVAFNVIGAVAGIWLFNWLVKGKKL